ncbi:MAG: hypothetical protein ACREEM_50235 [Blastocatellia bacterium]
MRKSQIAICIALFTLMIGYAANHLSASSSEPAQAAEFLKFDVPIVTHGFETANGLPDGDLFLLPKPLSLGISDPSVGVKVSPVNIESFGGDSEAIGGLPGVTPNVLAFSARNSKVRALSCAEDIWDGNLLIASTGSTEGDTVRLFLEHPDGVAGPELALFTIKGQGVSVSELHPQLMMYVNNRYATGPMHKKGAYIGFAAAAGLSGLRTDLLTLSWPMHYFSVLQGCFRVGVEIARGDGFGATSVVVTDIVVNRNATPGDENNLGVGLLKQMTGGYPSGLPCKKECPFPTDPPAPNPQQPASEVCSAICHRSPLYFRLNIDRLPHGTVIIGGMNFNRPISTTDKRAIAIALRGGYTPLQKLNQEFVAAQLNLLNAGGQGSPRTFSALESRLKCYGMDFEPITMSNGFTLTPDTQLKDLYAHCRKCIELNMVQDMPGLVLVLDLLNGNNPLGVCSSAW